MIFYSPEFEIAAYTISLLLDKDGKADVTMGEYEVSGVWNGELWKIFPKILSNEKFNTLMIFT